MSNIAQRIPSAPVSLAPVFFPPLFFFRVFFALTVAVFLTAAILIWPSQARAQEAAAGIAALIDPPEYASLRPDTVNLRSGPGLNYAIEWVYQRRNLPVQVVARYDTWRRIRDHENTEGWVHQSMLTRQRHTVVMADLSELKEAPSRGARAVARLERGVVGALGVCADGWCEVSVGDYSGWIPSPSLWGAD